MEKGETEGRESGEIIIVLVWNATGLDQDNGSGNEVLEKNWDKYESVRPMLFN